MSHHSHPTRKYTILVEASKLGMDKNDGCKRYVTEIVKGLVEYHNNPDCPWNIIFHVEGRLYTAETLKEFFTHPVIKTKALTDDTGFLKTARQTVKRISYKMLDQAHFKTLENWQYNAKMTGKNLITKYYKLKILLTASKYKYDLIHLTLPVVPRFFDSEGTKYITTIHDFTHMRFPEFHVIQNVINIQKGIDFSLKKSSWWIAISNSTKKDLQDCYQIQDGKIFTIYEAADHEYFSAPVSAAEKSVMRKKYNIPPQARYILSLSTLEPRKNIRNTIIAFHQLLKEVNDPNLYLVIAGRTGWLMNDLLKDNGIKSDKIIFTGFVAERDLPIIYNGALALSYVSFYEGFGLPPLEAMSSGIPVIYGDNSSQSEIISDAGIAADAHSIESIKSAMKKIVSDEPFRLEMQKRAKERAFQFSWDKCVEETIAAYKTVLEI